MANPIKDICDVIDRNHLSDDILFGHSYGGIVISGVAKQRPNNIRMLLYLDSPIPENNESLLDLLGPEVATIFHTAATAYGKGLRIDPFPPLAFRLTKEEDISWAVPLHTLQSLKTFTDRVSVLSGGEAPHLTIGYIQCIPGNSVTDA